MKQHRSISHEAEFTEMVRDCSPTPTNRTEGSVGAPPVEAPLAEPTVVSGTSGASGVSGSGMSVYSSSGGAGASLATGKLGLGVPRASGRIKKQWVPCNVCGLDVTWPYVLHSDASRAVVAHNCRKCGEVVCTICSPSGDSLPGDGKLLRRRCCSRYVVSILGHVHVISTHCCSVITGLNQSYQLLDYRVSLPECGLFSPQRVCLLCYFDT
jgi:hypothetical protein